MATRMKILVSAFVVIYLILNSNLFSQNFWQQTNGPYGGRAASFSHNQITHNFYCFCSGKIYKCLPDSNKWEKINTPFSSINCFSISPTGVFFCSTVEDRLYKSTNEGLNWEHLGLDLPDWLQEAYMVFPIDGSIVLGSFYWGIFRSTNNGYNWINVCNSIGYVKCMVININGDIFAGSMLEGLYKSTNNGVNWNPIAFQDSSVFGLAVNSKGFIFAAADGNIHRSTNNGENWTLMFSSFWSQCYDLFVDKQENIYAGTDFQGVLVSTDEGNNWYFKNNGLSYKEVTCFGEDDNNIYCGTFYGKGIYKLNNTSDYWIVNNKGIKGSFVNSMAIHPSGRIFAHVKSDGIYYSVDDGINWVRSDVNDTTNGNYVSNFAISNNGDIYALSDGLFKSTDIGTSWIKIPSTPNISYGALYVSPNGILFISNLSGLFSSTNAGLNWVRNNGFSYLDAFNINSNGVLFAANSNQIYSSMNNGNNWIFLGVVGAWTQDIAIDKNDNVYIGSADQGVFKSSNNGVNWQNIGLNGRDAIKITINKYNEILVCTDYGLFASTNIGLNWFSFGIGIPREVISFAVDSLGYFFAGTYQSGVFKTLSPLISVKHQGNKIPQRYYLHQNFPNPFNPATNVKFEIPVLSNVNISVYDALGKKVKELVNERLTAGIYEVRWNAENFSSGIYFYSLQTEEFTQSKKMILLK